MEQHQIIQKTYLCALMRKTLGSFLFLALFSLISCKSQYEKVRTSGDLDAIMKYADQYYEKEDWVKAKTLYELALPSLRGRPEAEKVYYNFADCHYQLGEYILSSYYFKTFSNTYTNSPKREDGAYLAAYSKYLLSPTYRLAQEETVEAIDELQLFANTFPNSDRVSKANDLIDELRRKLEKKAYAEGSLYYDLRQYQSAMNSFDNLLLDYPESPDVERVRYLAAKSAYNLADNSILNKRAERYTEAIRRSRIFLEKYPDSQYTDEMLAIKQEAEKALAKYRGT